MIRIDPTRNGYMIIVGEEPITSHLIVSEVEFQELYGKLVEMLEPDSCEHTDPLPGKCPKCSQ